MRLTSFSDFSMRVLLVAAARTPQLTTVSDVAASFGLSEAHVVKCVHQLGRWGFLETVRGNGGGFRLAKSPETIRLGDVLRNTEENFHLVECFNKETNTCRLSGYCKLQTKLGAALAAFLVALQDITLADVMLAPDVFRSAVGLEPYTPETL